MTAPAFWLTAGVVSSTAGTGRRVSAQHRGLAALPKGRRLQEHA